jgi:CarD family transcriptional regulator
MSFDGQKARARADCAAPTPKAIPEEIDASARGKTRFGFTEMDFIVYPAHGVGQIIAIDEQAVAGASLEFFVIYFAKSKMTVRVPTRKATNLGLRKPSDPTAIERVKRLLREAPRKGRGTWSRLVQEYGTKINSGCIVAVAEVVRDLCRPGGESGQSLSERQLYVSALNRLAGEIALVDRISDEQAGEEIENLVKTSRRSA